MDTQEDKLIKEVFNWIITIALALVITLIITNFVIINAIVPTDSMEDTIMTGDHLITNRLAYRNHEIARGDIIVFPNPDDEELLLVKRVIGLPNENVEILDGNIYIDGVELDEPYVSSDIIDKTRNSSYEVPENHVFVLGDNRMVSHDSRYWENKYVDVSTIKGKVIFRYWPRPAIIS